VAFADGLKVGALVALAVGAEVGTAEGEKDASVFDFDGTQVGSKDGANVVGFVVGCKVGYAVSVGCNVGVVTGRFEG